MMNSEQTQQNAINMKKTFQDFKNLINEENLNFKTSFEKLNDTSINDNIGYTSSLQLMMIFLALLKSFKEDFYKISLQQTANYLEVNQKELDELIDSVLNFNDDEMQLSDQDVLLQYGQELMKLNEHSQNINQITNQDFKFADLLENENLNILDMHKKINPAFIDALDSFDELEKTTNPYYDKLKKEKESQQTQSSSN